MLHENERGLLHDYEEQLRATKPSDHSANTTDGGLPIIGMPPSQTATAGEFVLAHHSTSADCRTGFCLSQAVVATASVIRHAMKWTGTVIRLMRHIDGPRARRAASDCKDTQCQNTYYVMGLHDMRVVQPGRSNQPLREYFDASGDYLVSRLVHQANPVCLTNSGSLSAT